MVSVWGERCARRTAFIRASATRRPSPFPRPSGRARPTRSTDPSTTSSRRSSPRPRSTCGSSFELPLANAGFALLARTGAHWGRRTAAVLSRLAALAPTGHLRGAALVELIWSDGRRATRALVADKGGQVMAALPCALVAHALASDPPPGSARDRLPTSSLRPPPLRDGSGRDAHRGRLMRVVLFFGGNGHAGARLAPARAVLDGMGKDAPFEIVAIPYPGFEGRPSASDREAFLDACAGAASRWAARDDVLVYATGIGALFAVALRAQRRLAAHPLPPPGSRSVGPRAALDAANRSGRAGTRHPTPVRLAPLPAPLRPPSLRRAPHPRADVGVLRGVRTMRGHRRPVPLVPPVLAARPRGSGRCGPAALAGVEVWWGGRDRVVGPSELRWTERAIGVRWPERTFAAWGHYPMIDDPEGWVRALAATATTGPAVRIDR